LKKPGFGSPSFLPATRQELLQEGVIFQSIAAKPPADGVPAPHRVRLRCVVLEDVEETLGFGGGRDFKSPK